MESIKTLSELCLLAESLKENYHLEFQHPERPVLTSSFDTKKNNGDLPLSIQRLNEATCTFLDDLLLLYQEGGPLEHHPPLYLWTAANHAGYKEEYHFGQKGVYVEIEINQEEFLKNHD